MSWTWLTSQKHAMAKTRSQCTYCLKSYALNAGPTAYYAFQAVYPIYIAKEHNICPLCQIEKLKAHANDSKQDEPIPTPSYPDPWLMDSEPDAVSHADDATVVTQPQDTKDEVLKLIKDSFDKPLSMCRHQYGTLLFVSNRVPQLDSPNDDNCEAPKDDGDLPDLVDD